MADNPKTVWVHSRSKNHEVVCGNFGNQRTYQVVNHMFECEEADAFVLFKHWDFDDRFGGQFRMPIENYRPATDEEVDAFLAKYPEQAEKRNGALAESLAKQRAELEAQIAALNARLGTLAPVAEEKPAEEKPSPTKPVTRTKRPATTSDPEPPVETEEEEVNEPEGEEVP
jgi:cell division septation protein DedD